MPALTSIIAGIGLAAGAAGAVTQYKGQQATVQAEKGAENARQAAMNFDALRRQRQLQREQQIASANAVSGATNQGAQFGSGLSGGLAQISGQTSLGISNNKTAQDFGNQEFAANRALFDARGTESIGGGLSSLGAGLVRNKGEIAGFGRSVYNQLS